MATTTAAAASPFLARFGFGKKKAPPKKVSKPTTDRPLWFPGANAPEYLDGSLVGDYGFDPFGLGKPAEYLQFDLDSLDQNLAKNLAGDVIGTRFEEGDAKSTPFQPYSEVFGLQRMRVDTWQRCIEFQRNAELDPEKRIYPGGKFFDPEKKATLQLAEIKHARLAMVGFLGFAAATGKGPLNNWATHLSDPLHTTIFDTFSSS